MDKSKQYEYKNVDLKKNILIEIKIDIIHLYLCGQVENIKWILCSRKLGELFKISDVAKLS